MCRVTDGTNQIVAHGFANIAADIKRSRWFRYRNISRSSSLNKCMHTHVHGGLMKINPFRRRPRNKRDRNSGNSALGSRDGMPARTNPDATRLDDVFGIRSISGPVHEPSAWTAMKSSISNPRPMIRRFINRAAVFADLQSKFSSISNTAE